MGLTCRGSNRPIPGSTKRHARVFPGMGFRTFCVRNLATKYQKRDPELIHFLSVGLIWSRKGILIEDWLTPGVMRINHGPHESSSQILDHLGAGLPVQPDRRACGCFRNFTELCGWRIIEAAQLWPIQTRGVYVQYTIPRISGAISSPRQCWKSISLKTPLPLCTPTLKTGTKRTKRRRWSRKNFAVFDICRSNAMDISGLVEYLNKPFL
jgi:hypothetical protein